MFGCAGYLLLCGLFSSHAEWGATLCCGVLASHGSGPFLVQSTGSRMWGFSSRGTWAQQVWLPGFTAEAQQLGPIGLVALQHVRPWIREPSLLHWQADSLPLSHQEVPINLSMPVKAVVMSLF